MALFMPLGIVCPAPSSTPVSASRSFATSSSASNLSFFRTESLVGGANGKSLSLQFSSSLSISDGVISHTVPSVDHKVYCGRGDKKTAKGKRFKHSFGNARPRNKNKGRGPPRLPAPPAPPRKDKFDDGSIIKIDIDESLFS